MCISSVPPREEGAIASSARSDHRRHSIKRGHREEDRRCRGGERNAGVGVAPRAKTPVQRGTHVVKRGEVDRPFVRIRCRHPCAAGLFQPSPVVARVAGGERGVVRLDLEQIGARGIEQTVAHHRADRPRRDHRFGDEAVDGTEQLGTIGAFVRHDLECRVDGEVAYEDRQPPQHEALDVGQEPVAPVQCRLQRLLPRRRGALALPEQIETLVEQRGGLLEAVSFDTAGGELDRQSHAVELAADPRDDRGLGIVERDLRAAGRGTFEEELKCGVGLCRGDRQTGAVGRNRERCQSIDLLALHAQGFAAGGEDMDIRRSVEDLRG